MRLGCIADDLTGATDLGVTLAREGLSVVQVNGVPDETLQLAPSEAIVVALKSRTNAAAEAVPQSASASLPRHDAVTPFMQSEARNVLVCRAERLAFPIKEGVPMMLEEDARQLASDDPLLDRN